MLSDERQVQHFCEEFNTGPVCLAVDGRRSQSEFQSVAEFANHRIPTRSCLDAYFKGDACRTLFKIHHLPYDKHGTVAACLRRRESHGVIREPEESRMVFRELLGFGGILDPPNSDGFLAKTGFINRCVESRCLLATRRLKQ